MLSNSTKYGLRAIVFVATQTDSSTASAYVPIRHMSQELDISFHFLTKILQRLTEAGLLESSRGPAGGVRLAQPASKISLADVVAVLEGENFFSGCVLGLPECSSRNPCPLHQQWQVTRRQLQQALKSASLSKLAKQVRSGAIRGQ